MKVKYLLLCLPLLWSMVCGGGNMPIHRQRTAPVPIEIMITGSFRDKYIPPKIPEFTVEGDQPWLSELGSGDLTASTYFVYDIEKEEYLALSGAKEDPVYPASITKLFSAWVALQHLHHAELLTVGPEITLVDADSSLAGLRQGDLLTVAQLVSAMMLPSGNDAAYTLAVAVGRKLSPGEELSSRQAVNVFVEEMNRQAQALNLTGSHFMTPDGIHDSDHYISIQDLVTISRLALENIIISTAVDDASRVLILKNRTIPILNTNLLLQPESEFYCQYAAGMKTGYTSKAGNCLLTVFRQNSRQLLVGVFGCPKRADRFRDTLILFAQAVDLEIPTP